MKDSLSGLNNRYKLFAYVFLISIAGLLITTIKGDSTDTVLLSLAIGVILFIVRPIWFPNRYGETSVRILSLGVAASAVAAFVGWPALLEKYLGAIFNTHLPTIGIQNSDHFPLVVFIFLAIVIYLVNNFRPDQTGMGVHADPIDSDIPEPSFNKRVESVCELLTDCLNSINIKTNWSTSYFTPLDAEVEVNTPSGKERKVTDLLKAIRTSKERLFLVLGDPGSGKSVALRKLCQDLAAEVGRTGKIPIYINLREWQVEKKWDESNSPTVEELYKFIFENVKSRDIVASKFFDKYFDRLYETGHLYFVLDSFDEIPSILSEPDGSELINQVSDVIFKFLKGGRQSDSQGILASRIFRKPTREFQTEITLQLRPFSEQKIISTFENHNIFDEEIIKNLFREREELVPVARNPFSAALIAEFIENNHELPSNQSEMYADYFSRTLDSCSEKIKRKGLQKERVIQHTIDIASRMFEQHGLEASVDELANDLSDIPVTDVIDILAFSRIARIADGEERVFSFSHRRFVEYFAVQKMILEGNKIELEAIPRDSQWRDTLVLYCEIADKDQVIPIADYCWDVIKSAENMRSMRVIHSMRFIADAFKGRTEYIDHFVDDLANYIFAQIDKFNNVLSVKIALETAFVLKESQREACVCKALNIGNPMLERSAINSFRNLSKISKFLYHHASAIFSKKSTFYLVRNRKDLLFSLSLSDAFKSIKLKLLFFFVLVITCFIFLIANAALNFSFFIIAFIYLVLLLLPSLSADSDDTSHAVFERSIQLTFTLLALMYFTALTDDKTQSPPMLDFFNHPLIDFKTKDFIPESLGYYLCAFFIVLNLLVTARGLFFYDTLKTLAYNTKRLFSWLNIIVLILGITFVGLFVFGMSKTQEALHGKNGMWILLMLLTFILVVFISAIYKSVSSTLYYRSCKRKLNTSMLNNREYIYKTLVLNRSIAFQVHVLLYLEKNVVDVIGEWPDTGFLSACNTDQISLRLAALEEKWLGLDR